MCSPPSIPSRCARTKWRGEQIDYFPYDITDGQVEPIYKELPGWHDDLTGLSSIDELPGALHEYIAWLEAELNIPITIVSVGPDRSQTLMRESALV